MRPGADLVLSVPHGSGHVSKLYNIELTPVADEVTGRPGISAKVRRRARAVAEVLFATSEGPPPPERLDWLVTDLDRFAAQAGSRPRMLIKLCLWVVWWIGPLVVFKLGTFGRLDAAVRTTALEKLEAGPLGLAIVGLKTIMCMIWFEHPEVSRRVGFAPACLVEAPPGPAPAEEEP